MTDVIMQTCTWRQFDSSVLHGLIIIPKKLDIRPCLIRGIDAGELTIRNIDLRRKTGYKQRRKNAKGVSPVGKGFADQKYREGRTYEDFESRMKYSGLSVVEMDTV
ncbi:MAG: hypothetical protein J5483_06360, partial [Lachnospiraceae bacterium]|nr:hypothetical protein [Lachnospiraceae bacterium]